MADYKQKYIKYKKKYLAIKKLYNHKGLISGNHKKYRDLERGRKRYRRMPAGKMWCTACDCINFKHLFHI